VIWRGREVTARSLRKADEGDELKSTCSLFDLRTPPLRDHRAFRQADPRAGDHRASSPNKWFEYFLCTIKNLSMSTPWSVKDM